MPTHALTLGELAHNITPAASRKKRAGGKARISAFGAGNIRIYDITPKQQEEGLGEICMKGYWKR